MITIFSKLLSMSIAASIMILAVIIIRLTLKKAPRWTVLVLWLFVGLRLICPLSFDNPYSLQPKFEETEYSVVMPDGTFEEITLPSLPAPSINDSNDTYVASRLEKPSLYVVFSTVWLIGFGLMLLYEIISYIRLKRMTREAVKSDGVYLVDNIQAPFVLGLIRPRIFVPKSCDSETLKYVVKHEKMHIARLDNLWKPLGFVILSLHWFNPLVWVAFVLFCRDIEVACDESAINTMEGTERAFYAQALLDCSTGKSFVSACPIAFGEIGVKERIKAVLKYKKPTVWITVIAVILCIGVVFFLMTDRKEDDELPEDEITVDVNKGGDTFGVLHDREELEHEIRYDFPGIHDTAVEYALDIGYDISVRHYKSGAAFGHVAVLNLAETVKVKNDEKVELYYMEYYYYDGTISPDENSQKFIYPVFFALHQNLRTEKWTRLGEIYDYEMKNKYKKSEMLEKYGDEFTAAAAEMYREYFNLDMGEKEQMILSAYKAAKEAAGWFRIASILEQESEYPREGDTYIELDGIRYFRVKRFPEYQGFVDYLEMLFSEELVEEFLNSEHRRYINVDGALYATTGIRGTNVHMGDENYAVRDMGESKYVVEVTVDVYGDDLVTVVDQQVFEFPYEFMGDRWVFTEFPKIR